VLSSITAKELNIEVGSNTDLKGSLIAAGYYDENGNFIDNGKLRLKTDTLTFSNLSNTRYDKSNSLSIGTNYAFKDPQQGSESKDGGSQDQSSQAKSGTSLQDKKNDTDPKSKISSINYSNNRNLSYSMSKSLATIGKGELIVGDKDISSLSKDELASLQSDPNNKALYNSDDLTRLNRDSSKLNKELYSTKLNSSVDASVDMRLFSEGGRNEIKRDAQDASTIYDAIYQIATTDRVSIKDFFSENGKGFMVVNGVRQELANNPELRWMLQSDELSDQEKQAITQNITRQVMLNLGYIPNQTKTIYTDETGRDGKQIMGFYSLQTGRSYINIKNNESTKDLVATSATESQRAMDHQRGINFLQNEDDHSTYSRNFGNAVARYYGYALSSYGSGYGSAKINAPSSINQNYYASNNKEFSRLDKQKGANRQLHQEEVEWLNDRQKIAKFKDYIQKATSKRYTDDEAKKILAKGGISLSDESFNEAYKESLSDDELADIGLAKEYIKQSDFYNKDLDGTNAFNPTASQYKERYMYLNGFINNQNFYIDNLKVDKPFLDDIAGFGKGFISGGWNFISNSVEGAYDTAKGAYNKIATEGIYNLAVEGKHKLASIDPIEVAKGAVNYMSDTFDSAQIGFYKGNLDIVLADYEAVTKRDTEAAASLLPVSKGAKAAEGLKNIEKVIPDGKTMGNAKLAKVQAGDIGGDAIKGTPENKITKPASTEHLKQVDIDGKKVKSDTTSQATSSVTNNTEANNFVKKSKKASELKDSTKQAAKTDKAETTSKKISKDDKELKDAEKKLTDGDSNVDNPLENVIYGDSVKKKMAKMDFHSFPEEVLAFGKYGEVTKIIGRDGIERTGVYIKGSYRGRDGVFEFIIENDGKTVSHRFFRPNVK